LWTTEEDLILMKHSNLVKTKNWKKIAQALPQKTPQQCSYRYNKLLSNSSRKKWNRNEDISLIELTERLGFKWELLVNSFPNRTAEELRDRYEKKLDPRLKRCKFEKEEDELIIKLYEEYGSQWNEIAKYFKDRSSSMIKNRFYSFLKKKPGNNGESLKTNSETSSVHSSMFFNSSIKEKESPNVDLVKPITQPSTTLNVSGRRLSFVTEKEKQSSSKKLFKVKHQETGIGERKTVSFSEGKSKLKTFEGKIKQEIEEKEPHLQQNEINSNLTQCQELNNYLENFYSNSHIIEDDMGPVKMNFDEEFLFKMKSVSNNYQNSGMNNNLMYRDMSNTFNNPRSKNQTREFKMEVDDKESNDIPLDLMKIDSDSPKFQFLKGEDNNLNNFNEQCKNAFNFHQNDSPKDFFQNKSNSGDYDINPNVFQRNNSGIDNESLSRQYQILEEIFQKVYEVSNFKMQSLKLSKFIFNKLMFRHESLNKHSGI
jgi:hypothetical protein